MRLDFIIIVINVIIILFTVHTITLLIRLLCTTWLCHFFGKDRTL